MTVRTPKQVTEAYFEAVAAKDTNLFVALFDEGVLWHQPGASQVSGTIQGITPLLEHFDRMKQLSKGSFHFTEIGSAVLSGKLAAIPLRFSAEHARAKLDMPGMDIMRIENGKIIEMWLVSEEQETEDFFWNTAN